MMSSLFLRRVANRRCSQARLGWARLALLLGVGAAPAVGQTTWTGAANDGEWGNDANWSNNAPTAPGEAIFDGQGQSLPITGVFVPNFAGTTFNSGSYTFSSALLIGALTVNAGAQQFTGAISLNGTTAPTVASGASLTIAGSNNRVTNGTANLGGAGDYYLGSITSGGGALSMNGTGTLALTGVSYVRPLTLSSGTLALGTSVTLIGISNNLTLNSGTTTAFNLNGTARGTTYDALNITGGATGYGGTLALNFGSTFNDGDTLDLFDFSGGTITEGRSFDAITASGAYSGSFTNNSGVWTLTNGDRTFTFTESTGDLGVVVSAIPEPATSAALAAIGALGLAVWRRKRSSAGR